MSDRMAGDAAADPGNPASATEHRTHVRPPDRRSQRSWVPTTAGWLCFLIGLLNVLGVIAPEFHQRLHRINSVVPGGWSGAAAARTAEVIVGLLLLILSHALRRRKRRAWRAVTGLLAL